MEGLQRGFGESLASSQGQPTTDALYISPQSRGEKGQEAAHPWTLAEKQMHFYHQKK